MESEKNREAPQREPSATEAQTEAPAEARTEARAGAPAEARTETQTEAGAGAPAEARTGAHAGARTEAQTEAGAGTRAEARTDARTEARQPEAGRPRKPFPTMGDLFAMLGIVFGFQIIVGLVVSIAAIFSAGDAAADPQAQGRLMAAVYFFSMFPALAAVLWYRRSRGGRGPVAGVSTRGLNPALLLWAFVFMLATGIVFEPLMSLLPMPSYEMIGRGAWMILSLVVMAPVMEELLCRGVVLGSLRARYGVVPAWLLSALFFGVLHVQPLLVVNAFVLGLILGFIYIATNSIWAVMILHALNNAVAYLQLASGHDNFMFMDLAAENRMLYLAIYLAALAVTALSGVMAWRTLGRLKAKEKNPAEA